MTKVLVVHHDHDVADAEVQELRRAGYEVEQCAGPIPSDACPVLHGAPCWQVDEADVLLYDVWAAGDGGRELVEDLRAIYPDKPVVLTSGGLVLDWVETQGPNQVTPVLGPPDRRALGAAVEAALAGVPAPAEQSPARRTAQVGVHRIPRW